MRRLGRTLRQRQPSAQKTIAQKVAAILRKYGTDAHVYLPGIGVINGFTAGNYLDSVGTTAATVDNPVGLVLDANGSVGSELVTNGDFTTDTNWTKSGGASISGGKGRLDGTGQPGNSLLGQLSVLTNGKTYKVELTIDSITGTLLCWNNDGTVLTSFTTTGTKTFYFRHAIASGNFYFCIGAGAHASVVDNVSIKEVTGIHAIQSTTANKPVLRQTSGRYWWDMVDGTDLLTATYPAGWESVTTIDAAPTGQATLTAQNIVGTYNITTDTYGRFVFKTLTASELSIIQTFANRLAGV